MVHRITNLLRYKYILPKVWRLTYILAENHTRLLSSLRKKYIEWNFHCRSLNEWFFKNSEKIRETDVKQDRYHIFCPRWQQNPCLFWDAYRFLHVFIREINVDFTICLTFEYFYSRNFRKNINFLDLFQFLVFMYFFQEKPPTACLSLLHLFGLSLCFEKVCKSIIAVFCFFPMDTFGFFWSYLN